MKKILLYAILGVVVLGGFGAIMPETDETYYSTEFHASLGFYSEDSIIEEESIVLSDPVISEDDMYVTVHLNEASSFLMDAGKPMLPVIAKTLTFPLGAKIVDVKMKYDSEKYVLSKKIKPSPMPVSVSAHGQRVKNECDDNAYSTTGLYPSEPFTLTKCVGLNEGNRVLFLTLRVVPQYSPSTNTLSVPSGKIDLRVAYILDENPLSTADTYDMLIVAPRRFISKLQPLVDHKNSVGVRTLVESVEDIYASYDGIDQPEDIKLRIRDAIEEWGIKYVLLVGGRKGQSLSWYIPERKSNCYTFFGDHGYSTDLYYADIYKVEDDELVFENWDSNGNGIFGEWSWQPDGDYDYIDYCPDVYLGRLPCRYEFEVESVVDKIIAYESSPRDPAWFKRFIGLGNDILVPNPHNDHSGIPEGDIMCDVAAGYLETIGFEIEKLYPSDGSLRSSADFINAFNQGAGFMLLTAHASPALLKSHRINSTYGFDVFYSFDHMKELNNGEKLPVIVNCGCHCSQFNVTILNFLSETVKSGGFNNYVGSPQYYMYNWVPECVDWWWVRLAEGGAIATVGNTHYGKMELGDTPYYFLNDLNPWIALRFFEIYVNQSTDILGVIHGQSITDYVTIVGGVNGGARFPPLQRNQVEEWILFGDPSLKIGGYP